MMARIAVRRTLGQEKRRVDLSIDFERDHVIACHSSIEPLLHPGDAHFHKPFLLGAPLSRSIEC